MTMEEWNEKKASEKENARSTIEHLDPKDVEVQTPPKTETVENNGPVTSVSVNDKTGTIALIVGILSIVFGLFFGGAPWIGILLGIGAIVLGSYEKKKNIASTKKLANAGMICGIAGLVVSILVGIAVAAFGVVWGLLVGILRGLAG